jgi:hypothetical protein
VSGIGRVENLAKNQKYVFTTIVSLAEGSKNTIKNIKLARICLTKIVEKEILKMDFLPLRRQKETL